jgi:hypothetical protein
MPLHEVWLELTSGTRVIVGHDLPDVPAVNAIASRWRLLAESRPDELHETTPGSGLVVRGSAIILIRAQLQPKGGALMRSREGVWL